MNRELFPVCLTISNVGLVQTPVKESRYTLSKALPMLSAKVGLDNPPLPREPCIRGCADQECTINWTKRQVHCLAVVWSGMASVFSRASYY
jgi:hypothetical protein